MLPKEGAFEMTEKGEIFSFTPSGHLKRCQFSERLIVMKRNIMEHLQPSRGPAGSSLSGPLPPWASAPMGFHPHKEQANKGQRKAEPHV